MKINIGQPELTWEDKVILISIELEEWELFYLLAGRETIGCADKDKISLKVSLKKGIKG